LLNSSFQALEDSLLAQSPHLLLPIDLILESVGSTQQLLKQLANHFMSVALLLTVGILCDFNVPLNDSPKLPASNNFYAIARYSPVGTCFSPIYKLPPSIDETAAVTLGAARGVNDVIFTGGNIVIAGSFDRIYSGDLTSFVPAGHVASWSGTAW